jgi:hypothetical protein
MQVALVLIMLHCPNCGCEMTRRIMQSMLGDVDVWICVSCKAFYKIKELKKAILTV